MRDEADHEYRELFAVFFARFARGEVDSRQWEWRMVRHYSDETLERIRSGCVRIRVRNEGMRGSHEELALIREWLQEREGPGASQKA